MKKIKLVCIFFVALAMCFSCANQQNSVTTINVENGGEISDFSYAKDAAIDSIVFTSMDGKELTWSESLKMNYADAILILHKGKIVYEEYFNEMTEESTHIIMSCTKSLTASIALTLAEEGKLNLSALITDYIPELKGSGYEGATVQQVLDMTASIDFTEVYTDPNSDIVAYSYASNFSPRPADYDGPDGVRAYMQTIGKGDKPHGQCFAYRTIHTDAVGWVIEKASGKDIKTLFEEYFWSKMGMEQDANFIVDSKGVAIAGGGFSACLRDLGRFGEMVRNNGMWQGEQILPPGVVPQIQKGGSREAFLCASYPTLPNWTYKNMWWVSHNEHGAFTARGIQGQTIYIDPKAEMVLVRLASNPVAANPANDPISLPAYHEIAKYLMTK